jgi:membrane protein DedA with SNARE-associated domain
VKNAKAISIPAGIARMSILKFTLYTMAAVIPWSILFMSLGMKLGQNWNQINEIAKPYVQPITIVAVILTIGYILYTFRTKRRVKID